MEASFQKARDYLINLDLDIIIPRLSKQIRELDSNDQIVELINSTLPIRPIMQIQQRPHDIDRFDLFRVRYDLNEESENIDLITTYSYPIPNLCKSNGRANTAYHPVFYCSDNLPTSIAECKLVKPCVLYISKWIIRCNRPTLYTAFYFDKISDKNPWIRIAKNREKELIQNIANQFGEKGRENFIKLLKFYSSIFINDKPPYNFSSHFAHEQVYGQANSDYIIYPSAELNSAHCNLAFHPNFVEEFVNLDKVYRAMVTNTFKDGIELVLLDVGEYFNNKILWRKPMEEYDAELKYFPKKE